MRFLPILLVLAICPYFIDLDGSAIWDANEAFYVETPREMMERGDYISPTFNYEPRLNKPVLSYWIVAAFYHAFGISPGVQRIPIAIGAIVMIGTAFWLAAAGAPGPEVLAAAPASEETDTEGTEDTGQDQHGDTGGTALDRSRRYEAGLWAAVGLAVTPRLLMFARRILIDVYISMFLGLTLLFFALAERYPARRRLFLIWMYVAAGLGVLTKGPIAVVLPGLVFAFYLAVHRELGRVRTMMLPAGVVIVAAIVVPWYAALYVRHGFAPIREFIIGENLARYTEGVGVDAVRPLWFYAPVIFSDSFPWSALLIVAAAAWFRERRLPGALQDPSRKIRSLLWLWIVVTVLFFTASDAKQDLYIFPIVPAVAALAGITIAARQGRGDGIRRTGLAIGVVVAAAGAGVLYVAGSAGAAYVFEGSRIMGTAGVLGGAAIAALAAAGRARTALGAVVVTFIVLDWVFVLRVLPGFEQYKPVPGFAGTLAARLQPDDQVVTYDEALPSLVFYLRRHVDPFFIDEELFQAFRSGRIVYAILSVENYQELAPRIGVPTCEIERRQTFDVKLKNMLAEQPPPELVLVTNRCDNG